MDCFLIPSFWVTFSSTFFKALKEGPNYSSETPVLPNNLCAIVFADEEDDEDTHTEFVEESKLSEDIEITRKGKITYYHVKN